MKAATPTKVRVRLFLSELNETEFLSFHQYRRPPLVRPEDERVNLPTKPDPEREAALEVAVASIIRQFGESPAARQASRKAFAKQRANDRAALLKEFDAHPLKGPSEWPRRRTFKAAVREALSEYYTDPYFSDPAFGGASATTPKHFAIEDVPYALYARTQQYLRLLQTLAEQGNPQALQQLAQLVLPLVKLINDKAKEMPDVLGDLPQRFPYWPVLKSDHRDFDDDHRALLKLLQVGKVFPLVIAEGVRWNAKDPLGRWAIHLCQEIDIIHDGDVADEDLDEDDSEPWEHKLLELKPFSAATWLAWWEVAQGLLRHDYIDVVKIPELKATVKSRADQKSLGLIRKRIMQGLKDKFKSMAGENKF